MLQAEGMPGVKTMRREHVIGRLHGKRRWDVNREGAVRSEGGEVRGRRGGSWGPPDCRGKLALLLGKMEAVRRFREEEGLF